MQATLLIGSLSVALIFVGRFALDLVQSISTFSVLIVTCTAPWMVVMVLGFLTRRGWYDPEALQVFNRRQRGGRYWFHHGWNWRGMTAWLLAAAVGLAFVNVPNQVVGPFGNLAGGVDISLPLTLIIAGLSYLALLRLFPEPRSVFGPEGPRCVADRGVAVPPITDPVDTPRSGTPPVYRHARHE